MRVLFDTNVVLDVLLARHPWSQDAAVLWQAMDDGVLQVVLSASSVTDIHYIVHRGAGSRAALEAVRLCLDAFHISAVDGSLLETAYNRRGLDFEDDLQIATSERMRLDAIVTRDATGFVDSSIPALSPTECRAQLNI